MKRFRYKLYLYTFLFFLLIIFYLIQQINLINLQNKIKYLYDEIKIYENKNKIITLEIQNLIKFDNLNNLALEFGFVPVDMNDVIEFDFLN